jgi:hypothetical protein
MQRVGRKKIREFERQMERNREHKLAKQRLEQLFARLDQERRPQEAQSQETRETEN